MDVIADSKPAEWLKRMLLDIKKQNHQFEHDDLEHDDHDGGEGRGSHLGGGQSNRTGGWAVQSHAQFYPSNQNHKHSIRCLGIGGIS